MKLIETNRAPNPRRVRIFLHEKGIDIPVEEIDLMTGALRTDEYTAINPRQEVPVLQLDDGSYLSETVAICRYFEDLQPEPPLFGTGARGRAFVEMWQRRVELGLFFHVAQAFRHLHPAMKRHEQPQISEWGECNKPKAITQLQMLDDQLATEEFIAGKDFSIADITALVAIDFMKVARITRPQGDDELKHLERWYKAVSERDSARA